MRILAIGLGGAGTRIVDLLYNHDIKSRVGCVSAIAVDIDGNSLRQLSHIPDNARMHFPAIDPEIHFDVTSTINVEEVMTLIQKMDTFEIDSIMIFAGLGGSVIDAIPQLTEELRKSYIEPIFGVCVLPMRNEGKRRSSKAADDIKRINSVLDAVIVFDNETWFERLKAEYDEYSMAKDGPSISAYKRKVFPENPRDIYAILNEKIARQIGLLLRAGEFSETGVEAAEIVLDAGEVLNTLKGNGLVAIGYATEPLQSSFRDRFNQWRSDAYFSETSHKRATRIVTLAKRAVYEEISVPCDITSSDKALVLIAGPSQELSMKGFQTVRKWIDRSISGLEMRSGDYPVMNTRFVGIIIVLSGIGNIPRITELGEIRREYEYEQEHAPEPVVDIPQEDEEDREDMYPEEDEAAWAPSPVQPEDEQKEVHDFEISDLFEDESAETEFMQERESENSPCEEYICPQEGNEYSTYSPYPSSGEEDELQDEPKYEVTMAAKDGKQVLNDEVLTLEGVARRDKKTEKNHDDKISIGVKAQNNGPDEKLSLPGREERTIADMTRMTDGGGQKPPKNSVFGLKDIPGSDNRGPRDTALVGEKLRFGEKEKRPNDSSFSGKDVKVSFVKTPDESAYMGRSFSVTSAPKANDSALMGKKISVKSSGIRPNDSALMGSSVRLSRGPPKTKEILNGDVKMSARVPAPKDDLLTRAERRMQKTKDAAKEPETESPYRKGTISSGYEKKTEPEENDQDDDLFWIK
ncbi:tubulin/FtsZ family protein [Methanogenium organophilum]|uniref:Tubulin-like protein CetZ n=1 Tax=Methanogenium organophilum TaxID=2199 RepID=A0A9X9T997_METOG|nr:tubulin/FtsZ family protein [Methanogenium organophilum]WAI01902.1 tubulin/FtsZ family protein [Methanogenium organophilum]